MDAPLQQESHQSHLAHAGILILILAGLSISAAPKPKYDHYVTGDPADVTGATTSFGLGLMGGGTDVDALFTWMGDRAGGGDFVVIRASGADGYNQYVYDLAPFDSVETLVLKNRAASSDEFVLGKIRNAEALFIAGGDQSNYVNQWKGTLLEDEIHRLVERGVPIGGTSAGTAILSEFVYSAQNKSVTSVEALANPFSRNITLERDFLLLPTWPASSPISISSSAIGSDGRSRSWHGSSPTAGRRRARRLRSIARRRCWSMPTGRPPSSPTPITRRHSRISSAAGRQRWQRRRR